MTAIFRRLALVIAATASPACARPVATAQLVTCDAGNCLLIHGHRRSTGAVIRINERAVEASGRHSWQVRLPVATVRDWSAPLARTLQVAITDPAGPAERSGAVRLPVGLLGQNLKLASLVVRAP